MLVWDSYKPIPNTNPLSTATLSKAFFAVSQAFRHPAIIVWGWIRWLTIASASYNKFRLVCIRESIIWWIKHFQLLCCKVITDIIILLYIELLMLINEYKNNQMLNTFNNSQARTVTDVVPSPTSSSWTFEISVHK